MQRTLARAATATETCISDEEDPNRYDSVQVPTVLGHKLIGTPYSVANMKTAYKNLYGGTGDVVTENKWYMRFKPSNLDQLDALYDEEIELFDYPLDYDVVREGDYYDDGQTSADAMPWLYAVVEPNYTPPTGITSEVLQKIHVPQSDEVEAEAMRITGNPVDDVSCTQAAQSSIYNTEPKTSNKKQKKSILFDRRVPKCDGRRYFDPNTNTCVPDNCPFGMHWDAGKQTCVSSNCLVDHHWDYNKGECVNDYTCCPTDYYWEYETYRCEPTGFQPGPTAPPITTERQPAGAITVWDTQFDTNNDGTIGECVSLRNVCIIAHRLFKTDRVFTDNNGNYKFNKEFRKAHIKIRFENDHAKIRGLRQARVWQLFDAVTKNLGKFKGNLNNITHCVNYSTNARSRGARWWAAATVCNNVEEYYGFASQLGIGNPPMRLNILMNDWRTASGVGSTPLFKVRTTNDDLYLKENDFSSFEAFWRDTKYNFLVNFQFLIKSIDMYINYNQGIISGTNSSTSNSDELSELMFHELTHAAHYSKVGNEWWNILVNAEAEPKDDPPYGNGMSGAKSEIIAVAESWAYHMGHFMADRKYGARSGDTDLNGWEYTNSTSLGFSSHLSALEHFDPNNSRNNTGWIPAGLYYDLFDNRNDGFPVNDNVLNYTNQQFFNALDNDVRSIPVFRDRLLQENNNNQQVDVINLFQEYNY